MDGWMDVYTNNNNMRSHNRDWRGGPGGLGRRDGPAGRGPSGCARCVAFRCLGIYAGQNMSTPRDNR